MTIDDWRDRIDAVDEQILQLLNERMQYCLEIGRLKLEGNMEIYVPDREQQIHEKLRRCNAGPFSNEAVSRIFERIIAETRQQVIASVTEA